MQGWIKLHRKILSWSWYHDNNTFRLFIHILLSANHKDKKWNEIDIKKGSFITGRKKLSLETGLTEQIIRTSLSKLKSTNEITIKSSNKYSIISIVNYKLYQGINQQTTQQITNNQPTDNQQITTTKKVKKVKNENNKEIYRKFDHLEMTIIEFDKLNKTYSKGQIDNILDSIENHRDNKKYKSLNLTALNWLKRNNNNNGSLNGLPPLV